jgi:uncharacterized protein (DUF362 family)
MIIRWVSEDRKRKWIYPIDKDIYTKGKIVKQICTKAKIIGVTKVNIPSPMHPITPYNIILLEDEYGNRMPKKTMTEHSIGEIYELKPAASDNAVIITKIKYDVYEYLKYSLGLLHEYDVSPKDKILIKPSIIEPAYSYQSVTTNPDVLDALITYLKEKGVDDILVAEQSMAGNDTIESAKKSGILDVCKKHNVPFTDLRKSEFVEKEYEGFKFRIAKEAFERKLINVPVMKTHSQLVIAGAIENIIRLADEKTQKSMFEKNIDETLPKLLKLIPKFMTIGDATIGMQGQGPTSLGEPAFMNMFFLSKDPVALDSVFIEAGSLTMPQYVIGAFLLGRGMCGIKSIEVVGDELEAVKFQLKAAVSNATGHSKIKLIDGKADPYTLDTALKMSQKLLGLLGEEINLAIGPLITKEMLLDKKRIVAYGNDAIERLKELEVKPIAEITESMDNIEKIVLLKSILQDPDKQSLNALDKIKSKMALFGSKIKNRS